MKHREESSFLQKFFQKFSYKVAIFPFFSISLDDDLSPNDFPESLRAERTFPRENSLLVRSGASDEERPIALQLDHLDSSDFCDLHYDFLPHNDTEQHILSFLRR